MSQPEVYVVIAANRGIGLALVARLAAVHPTATIYGTARDLKGAKELHELAAEHPNVKPIATDASDTESIKAAAALIAKESGHVDLLIHNAGINSSSSSMKNIDIAEAAHVWNVNTAGPVIVYQAFRDLLLKSSTKKFAVISSVAGSVGAFFLLPNSAYGASKAALNYLLRAIAGETKEEGLIVTSIHPGFVMSDMGKLGLEAALKAGVDVSGIPTITPEESAETVLAVLEKNTETDKFLSYTGDELPW